jgi:surfactin synthase thioesterase subunit
MAGNPFPDEADPFAKSIKAAEDRLARMESRLLVLGRIFIVYGIAMFAVLAYNLFAHFIPQDDFPLIAIQAPLFLVLGLVLAWRFDKKRLPRPRLDEIR